MILSFILLYLIYKREDEMTRLKNIRIIFFSLLTYFFFSTLANLFFEVHIEHSARVYFISICLLYILIHVVRQVMLQSFKSTIK